MEKRAVFLARITAHTRCLAIAGTHGKTTTSSILAHILAAARSSVTAFLGGIAQNYQSNFVSQGNDFTVVEADEFDRSFLQLEPDILWQVAELFDAFLRQSDFPAHEAKYNTIWQ